MLNQRTQYTWWHANEMSQVDRAPRIASSIQLMLYLAAKRCVDVLASAIALILLAPLFASIAIAIKLDSPGAVLHVQNRTGRGGRSFSFFKFRSMTGGVDHTQEHRKFAEAYINGQTVAALQDQHGQYMYKPPSNGRTITRVGRWLRRTSLDELPQLINVLMGDMSLVGPRPTMDYETALYTECHRQRLAVTPGLTGWAQIHGRSGLTFDDIVTLDVEYISRRGFWLDMKILVDTVPVVLSAEHAG